jgi:hypothetical protein
MPLDSTDWTSSHRARSAAAAVRRVSWPIMRRATRVHLTSRHARRPRARLAAPVAPREPAHRRDDGDALERRCLAGREEGARLVPEEARPAAAEPLVELSRRRIGRGSRWVGAVDAARAKWPGLAGRTPERDTPERIPGHRPAAALPTNTEILSTVSGAAVIGIAYALACRADRTRLPTPRA